MTKAGCVPYCDMKVKTPTWLSERREADRRRSAPEMEVGITPMCAAFHTVSPLAAMQRPAVARFRTITPIMVPATSLSAMDAAPPHSSATATMPVSNMPER